VKRFKVYIEKGSDAYRDTLIWEGKARNSEEAETIALDELDDGGNHYIFEVVRIEEIIKEVLKRRK